MGKVPDFTESEFNLFHQTLKERLEPDPEVQLAGVDIRLSLHDRALAECPGVTRSERGANFGVIKPGDKEFRCQFCYREHEQFGTDRDSDDELGDCIITLLRVQAGQERDQNISRYGY